MPNHTCKDCRFWDGMQSDIGDCKRYPQQACTVGGGAGPRTEFRWPRMKDHEWCGELHLRDDHPEGQGDAEFNPDSLRDDWKNRV